MNLITLRDVHLHHGHKIILDKANLQLARGERACLIGRNGEGKTSLLNLLTGQIQADSGEINFMPGIVIKSLLQEVPQQLTGSIFEVVLAGLGDLGSLVSAYEKLTHQLTDDPGLMDKLEQLQQQIEAQNGWQLQQQVETTLSQLALEGSHEFSTLSGGLKRRVLLAQALVAKPDVLLLDEPTNHLDIEAIQWLENFLPTFPGCLVFVTHDRAFLQKLATRTLELDRGHLQSFEGSYDKFLAHKEAQLEAEATQNALFDKKLAQEEAWIRQGIKARRTRNEGRVRALKKLREERLQRRELQGTAKLTVSQAERSGRLVIEAKGMGFVSDKKWLFRHVDIDILRGDKIGIVGPNGCGKTTFLNCLLGNLQPTEGTVKLGTKLEVAYFDQLKAQLDDSQTLQDNVGEGSDFIDINGQRKHVIGYLQDFLFTPDRARSPISKLSGGERSRLLLAKLFSKPSNVLVLDEPTNDLDIETLELLEDLLADYPGTVLLISHDRAFLDNVATSTLVFEPSGQLVEYIGGYEMALAQRQKPIASFAKSTTPAIEKSKTWAKSNNKLSYQEQQRLKALPQTIEKLEAEIAQLHHDISAPDFYKESPEKIKLMQSTLSAKEKELDGLYQLWEKLEDKR